MADDTHTMTPSSRTKLTYEDLLLFPDAYARAVELALEREDVLTSPLFPDLALPLKDVFTLA